MPTELIPFLVNPISLLFLLLLMVKESCDPFQDHLDFAQTDPLFLKLFKIGFSNHVCVPPKVRYEPDFG
jgi:hypothetical protein